MQTNFKHLADIKKKKKSRRLTFDEKCILVKNAIGRNIDYHEQIHGHRSFGFTMGQIASMTGYAPSTALMNDLFKMVEHSWLLVETYASKRSGLSPIEHKFYLPGTAIKRFKRGKML